MPTVLVLGAYKLEPTADMYAKALEDKYGPGLTGGDLLAAEASVREELADVVLVEMVVDGVSSTPDLGEVSQQDSDQVPYDEHYLSEDGSRVIGGFMHEPPPSPSYRIAFWLHEFEPGIPLVTPWGSVAVPTPCEMPERLAALMPYEPVD